VASCIERALRGYGLPSDASIVEEAKQRALEEAPAEPSPENATRRVREMFEGTGATDANKRIVAEKRLEAEHARLVEQNRRNADSRLLENRRRERRGREERERRRRESLTRRPPPETSRTGAARA
jgi:hypothetical protein